MADRFECRGFEACLPSFLKAIPSPLLLVDSAGTIRFANGPAEQLFGYAPAELLGQPIECLVPARRREQHQKQRADFQANPEARLLGERQPLHGLRKDGSEVPLEIGLSSLQTETETLVLAVLMDLSARLLTEKRLRRRERELALIADNIPALLAYVGTDGCYRFVNQRYEEWFGEPRQALVGRQCRELVGEAAYAKIRPRIEAVLTGQYVTYEDVFPYPSCGRRWIAATYVPGYRPQGSRQGLLLAYFRYHGAQTGGRGIKRE